MNEDDQAINLKELFMDSLSSTCVRIADLDENGNLVIQKESVGDLHCQDYDRFLVPLFAEDNDSSLIGNGAIIGHYLITAAHVAIKRNRRNPSDAVLIETLFYIFEHKFHKVCTTDIAHINTNIDYDNEIHDDLAVFDIGKTYNSFKLYEKDIELGLETLSFAYNYQLGMMEGQKNTSKIISINTNACENAQVEWKNCFRVLSKNRFNHGESGCALFRQNVLYGIFIRWYRYKEDKLERRCEHVILNSKYIKEIIDKIEKKDKQN